MVAAGIAAGPALAPAGAAKLPPGRKCAVTELRAAVRLAVAEGRCFVQATSANAAVDLVCVAKARRGFNTVIAKAEKKGGCEDLGNAPSLVQTVGRFLGDLAAQLPPEPSTSDPCSSIQCSPGFQCAGSGNIGTCVPALVGDDPCAQLYCFIGSHCENTVDGPRCIRDCSACRMVRCAPNYHCVEPNPGVPSCIPDECPSATALP
jgi:hypothetical protein